ncbi:DUF7124 domain-containing protein [Halodesulfurarchaeum sp.]|uniref:DUF7124 domain-containing protein n=1 Tax=Halodesulfurarchaeum sp. TaxID=1980530 RepID=UPI002FC37B54
MPGVPEDDADPEPDPEPDPTPSNSSQSSGSGSPMPGVPETKGPKPAVESGGESCEAPEHDDEEEETHELTTAFTVDALTHLENPAHVVSEARAWSDWIGVVGDVDAPTMNTFLRRKEIDIDFFNGAAGPQDRLARVAREGSAFHSDRLVLVGVQGQEELTTDQDWEFEELESTAAEAGWTVK